MRITGPLSSSHLPTPGIFTQPTSAANYGRVDESPSPPTRPLNFFDRRDWWEEKGEGEEGDGALKHQEAESDEREPQIYI